MWYNRLAVLKEEEQLMLSFNFWIYCTCVILGIDSVQVCLHTDVPDGCARIRLAPRNEVTSLTTRDPDYERPETLRKALRRPRTEDEPLLKRPGCDLDYKFLTSSSADHREAGEWRTTRTRCGELATSLELPLPAPRRQPSESTTELVETTLELLAPLRPSGLSRELHKLSLSMHIWLFCVSWAVYHQTSSAADSDSDPPSISTSSSDSPESDGPASDWPAGKLSG
ncbi:uncharacterized protein LOC130190417 [Pseudoliparis swirei]|uniref:uncharacterized protein LOC130190417 n=1 Tax=Pseudoliparis swirei TaxID=2059687 RepID=UPI0024BED8EA|nr:uncharacterized protein LOC130190417 [Pseudoliparis swirei]